MCLFRTHILRKLSTLFAAQCGKSVRGGIRSTVRISFVGLSLEKIIFSTKSDGHFERGTFFTRVLNTHICIQGVLSVRGGYKNDFENFICGFGCGETNFFKKKTGGCYLVLEDVRFFGGFNLFC